MRNNSIISILLRNKNVNICAKLIIFLYYRHKNNDYLITDSIIFKYLKLENNTKNKKLISRCLHKLEEDKIIKTKIKLRRRYFKWLIKNDFEKDFDKKIVDIPDFNWLESALK